jgi:hypothetical protein
MATTTNYSWSTPDDTALVKDGAAAIRTLGSSVDTTTKALNPSTTLGDVEYRSSTANTNTRLGIGTTGQVLTVSGGVPAWATPSSGGMTLISTTTLTGASITLSSIPATYNDLRLVIRAFLPATDDRNCQMRLNGDTGSNYRSFQVFNGEALAANASSMVVCSPSDNSVANGLSIIDIPDYANTSTRKIVKSLDFMTNPTTTTQANMNFTNHLYYSTSAISSITLLPASAANFTSGTALLYGVK